ncbi:MAG: NAD kinase [Bacteroidales bacterium]|nr:NAD kinase [Bacteroidales bacterium]
MKIAVFSKQPNAATISFIGKVMETMRKHQVEVYLYADLLPLFDTIHTEFVSGQFSNKADLLRCQIDYLFSFGGDGTFLGAAGIVADSNIPIVGVNTGRIGFLTNISKDRFEEYFEKLLHGDFSIEERSLLHVESSKPIDLAASFALNDVTVRPTEQDSMNSVKLWVNDELVNTYWADGLIISTATGSTAYSLSCGGPILLPSAGVWTVTPVASHTLAVRPIVIPDDSIVRLEVESRCGSFLLAVDSGKTIVSNPVSITLSKEKFTIKTLRFASQSFFSVIREKLLWGVDVRNLQNEK